MNLNHNIAKLAEKQVQPYVIIHTQSFPVTLCRAQR
jgi:hypothetical protein